MSSGALKEAVGRAKSAAASKSAFPILSMLLVEAEGESVTVHGNDFAVAITCKADANVKEEGRAAIPANKLYSLLGALPDAEITIKSNGAAQAHLDCAGIASKLNCMDAKEFPLAETKPTDVTIELPEKQLAEMLQKTAYSVSQIEARANICGLRVEAKGGRLTFIATDAVRMALVSCRIPDGIECACTIPSRALAEIEKNLKGDGTAVIRIGESQAILEVGSLRLFSKLIDGQYPNWQTMTKGVGGIKNRAVVPREALLASLARARHFTSDLHPGVRFVFGEKKLTVSAIAPEVGEHKESIGIEHKGEEIEIGLMCRYAMETISRIDADQVEVILGGPSAVTYFRPFTEGGETAGHLCLIMPMRIK